MIKTVLLASCILGLATAAHAQTAMPGSERPASYTIGVASGYSIEELGFYVPGPVINGSVDYDLGNGWSVNAWAQYGDNDLSKEIDLTATKSLDFSNGVSASVTAGGYFYPTGGIDTIYVVSGEVTVPAGPVSLGLVVDRYVGGYEDTVVSGVATVNVGQVELSLGKTFHDEYDSKPLFVGVSVPVGPDRFGLRAGVRAFTSNHADGAVVELTRSF